MNSPELSPDSPGAGEKHLWNCLELIYKFLSFFLTDRMIPSLSLPNWLKKGSHSEFYSWTSSLMHQRAVKRLGKMVTVFACFQLVVFWVDKVTKDYRVPVLSHSAQSISFWGFEDWTKSLTDMVSAKACSLPLSYTPSSQITSVDFLVISDYNRTKFQPFEGNLL